MNHKRTFPRQALKLLLPIALTAFLLSACSTDYAPITGSTDGSANPAPEFQYPPLTEQLLADGPAPGFSFLRLPGTESTLDDAACDSLVRSRDGLADASVTFGIPSMVQVRIPDGANPENTVFTAVAPMSCIAVADFYPHPYQFNGMVEIRWNVASMGLPADFDYSTLAPWYINDAGEYVPVEYEWEGNYNTLVVRTDHFSRYIIGRAIL